MAASMCCRLSSRASPKNRPSFPLQFALRYITAVPSIGKEDEEVVFPPIKPRFPPGSWTDMTEKEAWERYDMSQKINELPTVTERIAKLCEKDMRAHNYPVCNRFPKVLEFQKYATKTHLLKGLPEIYNSIQIDDSLLDRLKMLIEEMLLLENEKVYREKNNKHVVLSLAECQTKSSIFKNIVQSMVPLLFKDNPALISSMIDEDVDIQAFWDRSGFKRVVWYDSEQTKKVDYKMKYVDFLRFQSNHKSDLTIRTEQPLPEFLPIDDELSLNEDFPNFEFSQKIYGSGKRDREKSALVPGFNLGDPCEFGLVSFHNTSWLEYYQQKYSKDVADEMRQGMGISTSFVWLLAQAYFQGFTLFSDITYPMTTQTVLTDGQRISFFAYQLNTIDLWKNTKANPKQNICWESEEMLLYEKIEDGKIIGFNEEACKSLLKFLLMKTPRRNIDLKPTLPSEAHTVLSTYEYISPEPLQLPADI